MHELIEQREAKLQKMGGSRAVLIPLSWLEKIGMTDEVILVLRICTGKKGLFIDAYRKGE